ncbi:MAG TPA: hypothetical protein VE360_18320, partial [Pyrinomonadaceae bacterium]|nr:hypothetical protein [Pyrinomonadaceae bacterium]
SLLPFLSSWLCVFVVKSVAPVLYFGFPRQRTLLYFIRRSQSRGQQAASLPAYRTRFHFHNGYGARGLSLS